MAWRILIAEPNPNITQTLRQDLCSLGFDVIQATNGDDAWELVRTQRPALVLMQAALPGLNSKEIVRRIRGDSQLAEIPILCVGQPLASEELVQWFRLGIDNYIDYPFSMQLLLAHVKASLRRVCR